MNNLTTRKIVLGLLMTLVLALGVQGTAEAFEVTKSRNSVVLLPIPSSGTTSEQTFTFGIRFSAEEVGRDLDVDKNDNKGTTEVALTVSDATITSFKVGSLTDTDTVSTDSSATVDPTKSTSSYTVTVKYTLDSLGKKEFIAGSTTVYTAYGVLRSSEVRALQFNPTNNTTNPKIITVDPNPNNEFYLDEMVSVSLGNGANGAIVEFERIWGTGRLYEDLDGDATGLDPSRSLSTRANGVVQSGTAEVRLRVGNGSTLIRASIRGANLAAERRTHDATYFYGGIRVVKVSGEPQIGTPLTQLSEPLIVEVRDWYPSSTSGTAIRDQEIVFFTGVSIAKSGNILAINDKNAANTDEAGFRPHLHNPDIDNNPSLLNANVYPLQYPRTGIRVKTDNSGRAKVYAVVGQTGSSVFMAAIDTDNNSTYGGNGDNQESFTATIQAAEDAIGSIEKESGDGQTGVPLNRPAPDALVVIVRDGNGLLQSAASVTFTTDSGLLLSPGTNDPGDPVASGTSRTRTINTDSTGRASVRFNVGNTSGAKTVRASIRNGAQHVIFNINGSGGGGGGGGGGGSDVNQYCHDFTIEYHWRAW